MGEAPIATLTARPSTERAATWRELFTAVIAGFLISALSGSRLQIGEPTGAFVVVVFAEGEVDRSPTGTGVSGRLAIHHARGELKTGESIVIESILGTTFSGRVLEETRVGEYKAVIPEVTGSAYITGRHEFVIDPADPLATGFMLR